MSTGAAALKRDARKAETRRALITAARELFARQGIEATSIDEIAASVGLTKGAIYAHFGSKAELVEETLAAADLSLGANQLFERSGDLAGFFTEIGREVAGFLPKISRQDLVLYLEYLLYVIRDPARRRAERRRNRNEAAQNGRALEEEAASRGIELPLPGPEIIAMLNATGAGLALAFMLDERVVSRAAVERLFAAIGYGLREKDAVSALLSTRPST